jgi:hypothetical protein
VARVSFLLRVDAKVLDALRRWADDELRSVNGQVDYLLRQALRNAGRLKDKGDKSDEGEAEAEKTDRERGG